MSTLKFQVFIELHVRVSALELKNALVNTLMVDYETKIGFTLAVNAMNYSTGNVLFMLKPSHIRSKFSRITRNRGGGPDH